jgi:hypothetical protein
MTMKRYITLILTLLIAAGIAAAQPSGNWMPRPHYNRGGNAPQAAAPEPPQTLTIRGNLALINGGIALEDGGTTYYIRGLDRLVGFVEGLKEGAAVVLEGYSFGPPPSPQAPNAPGAGAEPAPEGWKVFTAVKLTLNGREYDNLSPRLAWFNRDAPDGRGPGFPEHRMGRGRDGDSRNSRSRRGGCR